MTTPSAVRHTPSVSELQAALAAARNGQFASPTTAPPAMPAKPAPAAQDTPMPETVTTPALAEHAATPEQMTPSPTTDEPAQVTAPATATLAAPPTLTTPVAPAGGAGAWLLGTHGGAGARTLAAVLPGTRCAGATWPSPATAGERDLVVLVCRSDHRGLTSAQEFARTYRDSGPAGLPGQLQLLGVIVSADAPGRAPVALRRLERLLTGAVPILGQVPWQPGWRLGDLGVRTDQEPPAWVQKLTQALTAAAAAAGSSAGAAAR